MTTTHRTSQAARQPGIPIVLAALAGVSSTPRLAVAVSNTGGWATWRGHT